jgi:hypothetical protein
MTKAKLLQVLAGCLIKPSLDASQKAPPVPTAGPNHALTTAKKNSASEASATPSGMKKTSVLLFIIH